MKKAAVLDSSDMLEMINDRLKVQTRRPNIYAYTPHDKQYLFHRATTKRVLYIGGNRSGKTVGGAVETIYRAKGQHPYKRVPEAPTRGRVHSVDFEYGVKQIILPEIQRWIPPSLLKNGSWTDSYSAQEKILTLSNKSTIEFKSYEQDLEKFAGTSRHYNWFDEEPPKHIFNESQARLVDTNGDCFITMTPLDGMTWVFNEMYEPALEGLLDNVTVIVIDMQENPHLNKEAVEEFLSNLDSDERAAREHGQFVAVGGKIFKMFNKHDHVIPPVIPPKDWRWYSSFDFGLNAPTAVYWHAVSPEGKAVTFSEHYAAELTIPEHAKIWHARNKELGRIPDIVVGDPAGKQRMANTGMSTISEYARNGIYIASGNNDVEIGLLKMMEYLRLRDGKPSWQITENCTNLISEMGKLRWAQYSSKKLAYDKNKQEKVHKKDDHGPDSTRYFFSFMPDLTPFQPVAEAIPENILGAVTPAMIGQAYDRNLQRESQGWKKHEGYGTESYALEYG